jgi:hypothetical protein
MSKRSHLCLFAILCQMMLFSLASPGFGQQTLGGLTGMVTDASGGILPGTVVTVVGEQTGLSRTQTAGGNGFYEFANLPIGTYTLSFTKEGFQTQKMQAVPVQSDRTATVNAQLTVGAVNTIVSVDAVPLMNAVDTTNGYVLDKQQIQSIPLPTRKLYRAGDFVAGCECRTWRRDGR